MNDNLTTDEIKELGKELVKEYLFHSKSTNAEIEENYKRYLAEKQPHIYYATYGELPNDYLLTKYRYK